MISFPPEYIFQNIQAGQVYLMRHPDYPEKKHFFVVVNFNPSQDDEHIIVVCTSKIEKAKRFCAIGGLPQETIVELAPADYKHFNKNTVINCNNAELMPKQELIDCLRIGRLEIRTPVGPEILSKIRRGILCSPRVKRGIKKKLVIK